MRLRLSPQRHLHRGKPEEGLGQPQGQIRTSLQLSSGGLNFHLL